MLKGFVKIHRQMLEWGWYKDNNTKAVFLHLLLLASFRPAEYLGHKLMPGDAVIGRKALADQLGMSEQQVRTALQHLESTGEISRKVTNKFTIVTIANWDLYQLEVVEPTNNQPTINQQSTNNQPHLKNVKNVKNNNAFGKYIPEPPKYPKYEGDKPVDSVPMPESIRQKLAGTTSEEDTDE